MSGLVEFKNGSQPVHWMYGADKQDMSKEIMTLNDIQSKIASANG